MKYVVDGSFKGMVIGAGVVVVDGKGELDCHSFTAYHMNADSIKAEAFAIECAVRLIVQSKKQQQNVVVYTDNQSLLAFLNDEKESKDSYVNNLKKQILILKKYANLTLRCIDSSVQENAKTAHQLSRSYMKNGFSVQLANVSSKKRLEVIG